MAERFKFEPALLLLAVLFSSIEISFVRSIPGNVFLILLGLLYLFLNRIQYRKMGLLILISIPLAFGTWTSFWFFGTGNRLVNASIYTSRLYAYLVLGGMIALTTTPRALLINLHERFKLSNTFVYGILAALNLLDQVKQQIKTIQYAARLRGIKYHLWSPQLYFKTILSANYWANDLTNAMHSHGFSEGQPRTENNPKPWPVIQIIILFLFLTLFNTVLWTLKIKI